MKKIGLKSKHRFSQNVKHKIYNYYIILIVEHFIERNKSFRKIKQTKDSFRLYKSTERHNKNMIEEQKKLKEKQLNDKEKILQKYTNLYFFKINREKELQLKNAKSHHRLLEKAEKIEEIEKNNLLKKKELMKKLNTIEKRKEVLLKQRNDEIMLFNKRRKEYSKKCKRKRQMMLRELSDIRLDVLDYQSTVLKRCAEKEKLFELRRTQSTDKTLYDQMNLQKNMRSFVKKMEQIKSDNVMRKSADTRRKIFFQRKKEEEEKKKKEEQKLIDIQLNG